MPIRWFTCPDGGRIEYKECLAEGGCRMTNRCATRPYLRMVSTERPWTGKPSTTQLIRGTMGAFLQLTTEYAISPDDRAFMVHGTKAHQALQGFGDDEGSVLEGVLDGDDVQETGIFDLLDTEKGKTILTDYKTSGSYKVAAALGMVVVAEETGEVYQKGKREGEPKTRKMLKKDDSVIDRRDWELQLNKYRIELEKRDHTVDEMRIQCVVRDGNTWIARSRGVFRSLYYFPITRLPDAEVLAYFKRKREALFKALDTGRCTDWCNEHENWEGIRCTRYCEVAEHCPLGKYLRREKETDEMPIYGLTDQLRFPRLGKIRLGIKEKTAKGKEYPKEVDYFILDPSVPNGELRDSMLDTFHSLYGKQPKSIKIMFPSSDEEVVFPQYYKRYGSGTMLKCKGDGKLATCSTPEFAKGLEVVRQDEGGMTEVECAGDACPYYKSSQCSKVGTLNVMLPDIPGAGVWQINTGSVYSIINVNSAFAYFRVTTGRFDMIPVLLERHEQTIQHQGKKTKHWILFVNTDQVLAKVQSVARIKPTEVLLELPEAASGPVEEDILDEAPEGDSVAEEVLDQAPVGELIDEPVLDQAPADEPAPTDYLGIVVALAEKAEVGKAEFGTWTNVRYHDDKDLAAQQLRPALSDEVAFAKVMAEFNSWMDAQADKAAAAEPSQGEFA